MWTQTPRQPSRPLAAAGRFAVAGEAAIIRFMRTLHLTLVALWLSLAGCGPAQKPPAAASAPALRDVPIGLCEDHPPESTSDARIREDLQALAQAGVRVLRVSFGWDDLEPERDRYDFSPVERVLPVAEELGIRLIPYVCYTPSWLAAPGVPQNDIYRSVPSDVREFEQIMRLLAARYRGRLKTWELWNEPDNKEYWLGTPGEYAQLLAAGARGVRAGDPNARVVLGGIAGHLEFLEELLTKHDSARAVDIVNLHSYAETWNPEPIEAVTSYLQRAAELVRQHGEGEPLWLAEVGYSSFRRGEDVSHWVKARFDFEHTPQFQGAALWRILAQAVAVPEVQLIAWYELRDLPAGTEVIGDQNNRHLGVLSPEGQPKPAFGALQRAVSLLSGGVRSIAVQVRARDGARVEARAFQRADGRCVLVAWLPTQSLPQPPAAASAAFTVAARTRAVQARASDAYGVGSVDIPLQTQSPISIAELSLQPEHTHVVEIPACE